MANLQTYPEYKNSGLPWLGEIPTHWEMLRAKYLYREVDERSQTGSEVLCSVSHKTGVTPRKANVTMFMADSTVGYKICRPDDLVINTLWAWMAALGVSRQVGVVSPAYGVYSPRPRSTLHPAFAEYLLRTEVYRAEYTARSTGINASRLRLYPDDFLRIPILLPPLKEQRVIADYLDAISAEVRRFIRNRRRLIEILNEQKHEIINHAVTRGLDPNVRLKPSGVDWLGDIPQHWDVRRLRHLAELRVSNVDKNSSEDEEPVRLCNYTDVYKNNVITADMPFMAATATNAEIASFRLRVDDVIITKDSEDWEDIGVPAVVVETADDLVCGYHLAILRPEPSLSVGRFLAYAMQCQAAVTQLSVASTGVTRYGLSQGTIKGLLLPAPPVAEQEQIYQHINEATVTLDEAIHRAQREIDLIREYRTRLIVDVVTGKLDVRGLARELAEQQPEDEDLADGIDDDEMLEDDDIELAGEDAADE
jgi:type I restriction enzyme S subunit